MTIASPSWKNLALHVWGPLAVVAPALAFPLVKPAASLALIGCAVLWCVLAVRYGPEPGLTWRAQGLPLIGPASVVLVLAAIGTVWSAFPMWSVPKFASLLLGILIARAVLLTASTADRVGWMMVAYVACGAIIVATAAMAGPQWRGQGNGYFQTLADRFVPVVVRIPGAESGPNTNAIGGTILFFLPACWSLLWPWPSIARTQPRRRAFWFVTMALLMFVLLISQSRSAWGSALLVMGLVLAARFRAVAFAGGLAAVMAAGAALWIGPSAALRDMLHLIQPVTGFFDNGDRSLIWRFALEAIRQHPWFGVGFGAFRDVIHSVSVNGATYALDVPHAHNQFLQVALDLGVPGLLAYLALLAGATRLTWRICRSAADGPLPSAALGVWGGVVAIHVFGLVDCIALGAKVGIFFWIDLALIGAIYRLVWGGTVVFSAGSSPDA